MGCVNSLARPHPSQLKKVKLAYRNESLNCGSDHTTILNQLHHGFPAINHVSSSALAFDRETEVNTEEKAINVIERMHWQLSTASSNRHVAEGDVSVSAEELRLIKAVLDKNVRTTHYRRRVNILLRSHLDGDGVTAEVCMC